MTDERETEAIVEVSPIPLARIKAIAPHHHLTHAPHRPLQQRLFNSDPKWVSTGERSYSTGDLLRAHWGESGFNQAERSEIAFRLHQHASARWDQKLRSQQRSQATEECPATAILHKSRTRPVLRHFDTTAVLQQEQCPKYRHGSLIQRFIVGNSARAAMEQLPPPLPKAATYADGKVCGEALESEYKVASVLDEIFPANVTDEHEILWRRVRESLMQQRSTNTRERRRQALNKYGPDIIEIVTEAARCEPSYATAKARGDGSETSRDRVREDRQRAKSNAILFKQMVLQGFRKKLIARFGSLQKAFSRIALVGSERDMKIKEFSNTLIKTKLSGKGQKCTAFNMLGV